MARHDDDNEGQRKKRKHSHGEHSHGGQERGEESPKHNHHRKDLPFNAPVLTKHDYEKYRPVFTIYLTEKKKLKICDIPSSEAYARFKSFLHKWYSHTVKILSRNDNELPSKYYDPEFLRPKAGGGVYPRTTTIVGPTLPTTQDLQLANGSLPPNTTSN
jgi:hypothetical protein